MKCTWSRSRGTRLAPSTAGIQCLSPDRYDCTVILTVSVLSSVLEVQYQHNYHAHRQGWVVLQQIAV